MRKRVLLFFGSIFLGNIQFSVKSCNQHFPIYFIFLFLFSLYSCFPHLQLGKTESVFFDLRDSLVPGDSVLIAEIAPYKSGMDKTMNEVLNTSDVAMTKDVPEGLLGNFVADLILKKANDYYAPDDGAKVSICILNNGGLRTPLPKGDITRGKVFELMPFENEMVFIQLM